MTNTVSRETLQGFLEAFNRHDLDAIMSYFADDCVFYMPRGSAPRGDRYVGKDQVRAGLATRFAGMPDVHYGDDRHWVFQDFGVSEWTLTGTSVAGKHIEVRGVDLLEFSGGKIIRKDSFWKITESKDVERRMPAAAAWLSRSRAVNATTPIVVGDSGARTELPVTVQEGPR